MGEERWFFRNDNEWIALAERLKQTPCPHCQVVGALIRHGYLRGYDDSSPQRQTVRARRVFCSNRNARRGCGRTVSVWCADKIRRLSLTTGCLWRFLHRAAADSISAAIRAVDCHLSDRTLQRLWQRFDRGQSKIRTALSGRCPPPELPPAPKQRPAAHVLAHLHAAFPDARCPIAAFLVAPVLSRILRNPGIRSLGGQNPYGLNLATSAIRIWSGTVHGTGQALGQHPLHRSGGRSEQVAGASAP